MALGDVLLPPQPPQARRVGVARLDGRAAISMTLRAYLECAEFRAWGGPQGEDRAFRLVQVLEEWPGPQHALRYPSASIIDVGPVALEAHNLTPSALEDTWGEFGEGTVLWKLGEVDTDLQIDFWAADPGTREAMAAALPGLFAPGEDASRVVLEGPEAAYCRPVRASLIDWQRPSAPGQLYMGEYRLTVRVQASIDVVELREATMLTPRIWVETVTEDEDQ
jgi:hypothetical protein